MAAYRGPAEVEPQGAFALLADQGGPEVRTKAAAGLRFVGREDGVAGGAAQGGSSAMAHLLVVVQQTGTREQRIPACVITLGAHGLDQGVLETLAG